MLRSFSDNSEISKDSISINFISINSISINEMAGRGRTNPKASIPKFEGQIPHREDLNYDVPVYTRYTIHVYRVSIWHPENFKKRHIIFMPFLETIWPVQLSEIKIKWSEFQGLLNNLVPSF